MPAASGSTPSGSAGADLQGPNQEPLRHVSGTAALIHLPRRPCVWPTAERRATEWVIRLLQRLLAGTLVPLSIGPGPPAAGPPARAEAPAAWVQVSVATVWIHPSSPRQVDEPELARPARVGQWLDALGIAGRMGLHGRINTQVLFGNRLIVLSQSGSWSRVMVPSQRGAHFPNGVIGWVPSRQLTATPPPDAVRELIVSVPLTWLYTESDGVVGERRLLLSYDTELPELATVPGFVLVGLPGGGEGAIAEGAVGPLHVGAVSGSTIVAQARLFLGLPYLWGGTSAFGYDCSGLVYSVFARYGVFLPRDAADQQHAGIPVPLGEARPGDLLFFAGPGGKGEVDHVAIYAGDGYMIDSPYTGASVEEVPMVSSPAWPDFAGADRVAGVA